MAYMLRVYTCSGGTQVTVYGSYLNSVAEPRITLSVHVTTFNNTVTNITDSEVT